jgi:type I restriction enzyme M protein
MGTIFEELVRRFNEENNEEAGEHWTPRDAVKLMANLIFAPIAKQIESGTYLLYDGALGTGGMLTVAEETLQQLAMEQDKEVATHLYGQEINAETYAICKADLLLKGEGEAADNIVGGPEYSTLSNDAFRSHEFDFMLSNPPYGKSWKSDLERMGGKEGIKDARFIINHADDPEYTLITRSSDGQMLFLANMLSKMKHGTKLGSRIAEVHNGSSLFTGDAGQGESNIRRWIIENDWLEAIVALPLNMFYNTGIATYIWVVTNRKPKHRKGKVQLIYATEWYKPLRKNLGKKNCELGVEDIERIIRSFTDFKESEQSKVFDNAEFGYWKVTVERPLRLYSQITRRAIESLRFASGDQALRSQVYDKFGEVLFEDFAAVREKVEAWLTREKGNEESEDKEESIKQVVPEKRRKKLLDASTWRRDANLMDTAIKLQGLLGDALFTDHNIFRASVDKALDDLRLRLATADKKLLLRAVSWREGDAPPVIAKIHKKGKADTLHGVYEIMLNGKLMLVEYEPDPDMRDTEQVHLWKLVVSMRL